MCKDSGKEEKAKVAKEGMKYLTSVGDPCIHRLVDLPIKWKKREASTV